MRHVIGKPLLRDNDGREFVRELSLSGYCDKPQTKARLGGVHVIGPALGPAQAQICAWVTSSPDGI